METPARSGRVTSVATSAQSQQSPTESSALRNTEASSRRGRARSNTIVDLSNPFEVAHDSTDQELVNLINHINAENEWNSRPTPGRPRPLPDIPEVEAALRSALHVTTNRLIAETKGKAKAQDTTDIHRGEVSHEAFPEFDSEQASSYDLKRQFIEEIYRSGQVKAERKALEEEYKSWLREQLQQLKDIHPEAKLKQRSEEKVKEKRKSQSKMNYQNYLESPAGGSANPRQAPPSPSQNMNHANGGTNGAMGIGGGIGFPTPAGHQSDLNFIMGIVENLSQQLQTNQSITAAIVDKIDKVREKAKDHDLDNDQLISLVSKELNGETSGLETECSSLRKKLEQAEFDKVENWKLVMHACDILSDVLDKVHKFKENHDRDTLAWHKNYRKQLADEREENLFLRNHIADMMAAAARANGHLRDLRRYLTDHDELNELRIQNHQYRMERRFYKRMAFPLIPEDDSEWSDDDDLIDPEVKKRLLAEKADKEAKDKEGEAEGDGGQAQGQTA